jgi:hypothetical protein
MICPKCGSTLPACPADATTPQGKAFWAQAERQGK